jgi:hypothetical protein
MAENKNQITANKSLAKTNAGKLMAASMGMKMSSKEIKNAISTIKSLGKENTELQNRNSNLSMGIEGIETMRTDVEHNYSFDAPSSDDGTHHVTQGEGKNVIVEGSNDGLFLHEGVHIFLSYISTCLNFSTNASTTGMLLNPAATGSYIGDEVKAYQVQFSFNGSFATGRATKLADINPESVRDLHDDNSNYPYKDLK